MSEVENLDGRKITRDEYGRFEKVELDSSTARAMAKARSPNKPINTTSSTLLQEAGYSDPEQAPEHLRLLSEIASSKRASAVSALRDFRKLTTPASTESGGLRAPQPGEFCELCHQFNFSGIDGRSISDLLQEMRELDAGG